MDVNYLISEEDLAAAMACSSLKGFNIIRQEDLSKHGKPSFIFEKNVIFGRVTDEEAYLVEMFPGACTRKMLRQLTRDCQGKGLEEHNCLLGVEVYPYGTPKAYKVCPVLRIDIEASG
jgi:hypothetical protein